ncbi:FG-GAP repeat domain-containing protein [Nannocystis pusilla]|uniref:VCBS repeat-containing protein n=1 Tax=Nannocystis pusilla TaxID=889268 RepID=A0ABS7U0Y9_9BACT|nr:VCBS repeat-containing protein [Nannocystis pusilla]
MVHPARFSRAFTDRATLTLLTGHLGFAACGDDTSQGQTDSASSTTTSGASTSDTSAGDPPTQGSASLSSTTGDPTAAPTTTRPDETTDTTDTTDTTATSGVDPTAASTTGTTGTGTTGTGTTGTDTTGTDTDDTGEPPLQGVLDFDAIKTYSKGYFGGHEYVVADLDGDGRTDAVTLDEVDNEVVVVLAGADGYYTPGEVHAVPQVWRLALGDVNGDAQFDILVTTSSDIGARLLLGNGDGTFQAPVALPAVKQRTGPTFADIDDDGDLDLMLAKDPTSVAVHLGDGAGGFGPESSFMANVATKWLGSGDIDGDGLADLVLLHDSNDPKVQIGLSLGDGGFALQPVVDVPPMGGIAVEFTTQVVVADVDADGHGDVLAVDREGIGVLLGGPDGALDYVARYRTGKEGAHAAVGDWDGDGVLDLASTSGDDTLLYVRYGAGDGTFSEPPVLYDSARCNRVEAGDVDADGVADLMLGCAGLGVAKNRGDGRFTAAPALIGGLRPSESVIADFDEDGHADVVAGFEDSEEIVVFRGNGDLTFADPIEPSLPVTAEPRDLIAADIDEDGHLDLLASIHGLGPDKTLVIHFGDGTGHFEAPASYPGPWRLAVADLDEDGHLDVLTAGYDFLLPMLGDGSGALTPGAQIPAGQGLYNIAVADFDGDGDLDAAAPSYQTKEIVLFRGEGDGSFSPQVSTIPSALTPWRVEAGDFTDDGIVDLMLAVFSQQVTAGLAIHPGLGDGSFGPPVDVPGSFFLGESTMVVADFNNDQRPDVFYAPTNGQVVARAGLAGGGFGEPLVYQLLLPRSFAVGDVDHDDLPDVVIGSEGGYTRTHFSLFRNASY